MQSRSKPTELPGLVAPHAKTKDIKQPSFSDLGAGILRNPVCTYHYLPSITHVCVPIKPYDIKYVCTPLEPRFK